MASSVLEMEGGRTHRARRACKPNRDRFYPPDGTAEGRLAPHDNVGKPYLKAVAALRWGAALPLFVIPGLTRDPPFLFRPRITRQGRPRIKSGVTMMERSSLSRSDGEGDRRRRRWWSGRDLAPFAPRQRFALPPPHGFAAGRNQTATLGRNRPVPYRAEWVHPSSTCSTHCGTSSVAGPWRASSNQWLPWLGSILSSSVSAPIARASRTNPAAG